MRALSLCYELGVAGAVPRLGAKHRTKSGHPEPSEYGRYPLLPPPAAACSAESQILASVAEGIRDPPNLGHPGHHWRMTCTAYEDHDCRLHDDSRFRPLSRARDATWCSRCATVRTFVTTESDGGDGVGRTVDGSEPLYHPGRRYYRVQSGVAPVI